MKLLDRIKERRRRKAHQRYLDERERQKELEDTDAEESIREGSAGWGAAGQTGTFGN
jgi:hypothetical protein